jgi:hypothetical protein
MLSKSAARLRYEDAHERLVEVATRAQSAPELQSPRQLMRAFFGPGARPWTLTEAELNAGAAFLERLADEIMLQEIETSLASQRDIVLGNPKEY